MNQKLLTTLFCKNVDDLKIIADDFVERSEIPAAILQLAKRKTEDLQFIIEQFLPHEIEENQEENIPLNTAEMQPDENIIAKPEIEKENIEEESIKFQEDNKTEDDAEFDNEKLVEEPEIEENRKETLNDETVDTEEITEPENIEKTDENQPVVTIAGKMGQVLAPSRHEALYKTENSLGNSLGNKKVDDIKLAISIGDRFRFQRELFANNGEELNRTLNYINQLATFDEAGNFLKSKYRWTDDNETANDFLNIVKRKF